MHCTAIYIWSDFSHKMIVRLPQDGFGVPSTTHIKYLVLDPKPKRC